MQYINTKWTSLKDHKMKLWRILPAEGRQKLLLHSALITTSILSATKQHFFHFRACCVNAEFHPLHIGSAKKTPLCSLEASFCLLFHYFLQLFLKLKMEQNFNTIPSKCLYIYIHLSQVGLQSTGLELVISEITGWLILPSTCHWNWCQQICCKKSCFEKKLCRSLRFCLHPSEMPFIWSLQK